MEKFEHEIQLYYIYIYIIFNKKYLFYPCADKLLIQNQNYSL